MPKLAQRIERSGLTLDELLARHLNVAIIVQPADVPHIVAADPDDDEVVACALAANADLTVSGDSDLLSLKVHQKIPIVTPAAAVQSIGRS